MGILGVFIILHYTYDWSQNIVFHLFSGIDESNFQHWKIGFFSYWIFTGIEYLFLRKQLENKTGFLYAHVIGALIFPWITFIFWYTVPLIGPISILWIDIAYSIIACFLSIIAVSYIERACKQMEYNRSLKVILWILTIILCIEFIVFSFKLPWADVFADPTV